MQCVEHFWEIVMCRSLIWLFWDQIISVAAASTGMWLSNIASCFSSCKWSCWSKRKEKRTIALKHICKITQSLVMVIAAGSTMVTAGYYSSTRALQTTSVTVIVEYSLGRMLHGASTATVLLLPPSCLHRWLQQHPREASLAGRPRLLMLATF